MQFGVDTSQLLLGKRAGNAHLWNKRGKQQSFFDIAPLKRLDKPSVSLDATTKNCADCRDCSRSVASCQACSDHSHQRQEESCCVMSSCSCSRALEASGGSSLFFEAFPADNVTGIIFFHVVTVRAGPGDMLYQGHTTAHV